MTITDEAALNQIDLVLAEVEKFKASAQYDDLSGGDKIESGALAMRCEAAIERLTPAGSAYARQAATIKGHNGIRIIKCAGILRAIRSDVEAGFTQTFTELVHGAVFDDFLDMAAELHKAGYAPSAAVLAGSVLEEHLRKLADKFGEKPLRSVDALSTKLVKAGAFSEPQRKIVAGWYGQRTEAAHGRHANVIADEVGRMIAGVRDFLVRHPA